MSQSPKFKVDYNLLIENIKDLNTLAGEGVASIKHTKDGARLKVRLGNFIFNHKMVIQFGILYTYTVTLTNAHKHTKRT